MAIMFVRVRSRLRPPLRARWTHAVGLGAPALFLPGVVFCTAGCTRSHGGYEWVMQVGREIDPVAAGLEEYGTISVSTPILVPARPGQSRFEFGLSRPAEKYFDEAKAEIHGGAASFFQSSLDRAFGARLQVDVNTVLKNLSAWQKYTDELGAFKKKDALANRATRLQALAPILSMYGTPGSMLDKLTQDPVLSNLLGLAAEEEVPAVAEGTAATGPTTGEPPSAAPAAEATEPVAPLGEDAADVAVTDEAAPGDELADRSNALAEYFKSLAEGLSGPLSRPDAPTLESGSPPAVDPTVLPGETERLAKKAFTSEQFTRFLGLLGNEFSPQVSNRAAMLTASGDKTTQEILNFLGDPLKGMDDASLKVMFGVAMVSVSPGWRTYMGYAADVAVQAGVEYAPLRAGAMQKIADVAKACPGTDADCHLPAEARVVARIYHAIDEANETAANSADIYDRASKSFQRYKLTEAHYAYGGSFSRAKQFAEIREKLHRGQELSDAEQVLRGEFKRLFVDWLGEYGWGVAEVAAVSPMTETQNLDLKSSIRRQKASAMKLALAVSGWGATGQAQAFRDYAERLERDTATRSAVNTTTSYSQAGDMFGYHITPRLKGLDDPAAEKAAPGMVLDPLSFPVLIIMGLKSPDTAIRVDVVDGRLVLIEPMIVFKQTTRWVPLGDPVSDRRFLGGGRAGAGKPRLTEIERAEWAVRLHSALDTISENADWRGGAKSIQNFASTRVHMLRNHALGSQSQQHIPEEWLAPALPAAKP